MIDSEEEDDEDGLEYKTKDPLTASYTTPLSTGGHSKPSPWPSHSPTPEDSNLKNTACLQIALIKACVEAFLEEVEEDMELVDLPALENMTPLLVPEPLIPGFIPFTVSTGQYCVPPKRLLQKVYHPYNNLIGQCSCEPGGWCNNLLCSGWRR